MTHWLSTQARTLGALVGLALFLGYPAPASAEKTPTASTSKSKAGKKGKKTAQTAKKQEKGGKAEKAEKGGKGDKGKKGPRGKTAQAHGQPTRRPQAETKAPAEQDDCVRSAVEIQRLSGEELKFALTRCKGQPADRAVEKLSVLMRPYSVPKPSSLPELDPKGTGKDRREGELMPGIHGADPGLLSRLQAVASEFPGHPITIVSGYRPGGTGAYHRHGKAVDVRVEGVKTEALATFCRGLLDTGCGYYPNGEFVHIDVRPRGTGHVYWIDAAGPGEPSHFVKSWPVGPEEDGKHPVDKSAPRDETTHKDVKKKAGHGAARADRDHEED
ncbi:MAG: D-Ala-D-Ala carboxypeptidase family metallohydrolase [Polyangiaceae bacterium]|jgi:hypothetical protein|nr:D-Ala-D-Ala carboxypeptidase family metallohydrolase [Polyangiaceae bacterium]